MNLLWPDISAEPTPSRFILGIQTRYIFSVDSILDGDIEDTEILLPVPFSHMGTVALAESEDMRDPYHCLLHEFPDFWHRLDHVQYGTAFTVFADTDRGMLMSQTSHTRLMHSLLVAIFMEMIACANGLDEKNIRLGIIIGGLHDYAMPKFWDIAKRAFPSLCEEKNFLHLLSKNPHCAEVLRASQSMNLATLSSAINGKGLMGKILDIADKLSYTLNDIRIHISGMTPESIDLIEKEYGRDMRYTRMIADLVRDHPYWGDVIADVCIDRSRQLHPRLFFADADRLGVFLALRTCMFADVYYDPGRQAQDISMSLMIRFFVDQGHIRLDDIESHGWGLGYDTLIRLAREYRLPDPEGNNGFFDWTVCRTESEVISAVCGYTPDVPVFVERVSAIKTGSHFLVRDGDVILPYCEARPEESARLDAIVSDMVAYRVYAPKPSYLRTIQSDPRLAEFYERMSGESRRRYGFLGGE